MNKPAKLPTAEDVLNEMDANPLIRLRDPFPPHQISKLPKETKKQTEERKNGQNIEWKCAICGGMHHKNAVHLDYVGHAALTDRLLDVDPHWTWEPVGFTPEGLPALDPFGRGLWIKLTVCGVSRYGYGAADGKSGGDAMKEMIGDALRNAAMRFGAALDLWHKGDLHASHNPETGEVYDEPKRVGTLDPKIQKEIEELAPKAGKTTGEIAGAYSVETIAELTTEQAKGAIARLRKLSKEPA